MIVLDSSAVLAVILSEPGGDYVVEHAMGASISAINHAEIVSTVLEKGADRANAQRQIRRLRLITVPFGIAQVERTGELRPLTKRLGLSLGDRACLALAKELGATVLTSDRRWKELDIGIPVELIR